MYRQRQAVFGICPDSRLPRRNGTATSPAGPPRSTDLPD
jgi:hypothetical protein